MATNDEILFGRIAVLSKFVTQEQVDESIGVQEKMRADNEPEVPHLGTILVNCGHLSEREKRAILQVQKENLQRREAGTNARRQERIFGYLVMKLGYCTEQQVFECVREQAKLMRLNLIFKLGEVFVSKRYLSHEQVQEVLALQDKFIVTCPGCATKFNVVRYQAGTRVKCPECGTVISVPDVLGEAKKEKEERDRAAAAASAGANGTPAAASAAASAGSAAAAEAPASDDGGDAPA
ncbi:MAG: MJ0042-type zinc finger domain-containing protein, partial [Planctomycetota bacterium]